MNHIQKRIQSTHSPSRLYALVNDTESYQNFVPFCVKSEVIEDRGNEKDCRLVFAKAGFSRELLTRNQLEQDRRITVQLLQGDFSYLKGEWQFEPIDSGTLILLDFQYVFNNPAIAYVFGKVFEQVAEEMVEVFIKRADACKS